MDGRVIVLRAAPGEKDKIKIDGKTIQIELSEPVRALTPGQSAVLYQGERVVGGGIVI